MNLPSADMLAPLTPQSPRKRPIWVLGVVVTLFCLAVILIPLAGFVAMNAPGPLTEIKTVIIPHGASVREMARFLADNRVVNSAFIFRAAARVVGHSSLKAGEYEFSPGQSAADIAEQIHEGHAVVHWLTAPEGLTSADIMQMLAANPNIKAPSPNPIPAEGTLLPETYRYTYGDTRGEIVGRMQKQMQETLADLWGKRDPAVPLKSPYEAIILASVIEKETGKVEERPRIAGVFYNRLRINMRLQSDPTVVYAITKAKGPMDRDLVLKDLTFPSPINTYASDGIPSQPICNPGRAAIEAALHPEKNDFLYFVADGTGGHHFARTLDEHNHNVANYRNLGN